MLRLVPCPVCVLLAVDSLIIHRLTTTGAQHSTHSWQSLPALRHSACGSHTYLSSGPLKGSVHTKCLWLKPMSVCHRRYKYPSHSTLFMSNKLLWIPVYLTSACPPFMTELCQSWPLVSQTTFPACLPRLGVSHTPTSQLADTLADTSGYSHRESQGRYSRSKVHITLRGLRVKNAKSLRPFSQGGIWHRFLCRICMHAAPKSVKHRL